MISTKSIDHGAANQGPRSREDIGEPNRSASNEFHHRQVCLRCLLAVAPQLQVNQAAAQVQFASRVIKCVEPGLKLLSIGGAITATTFGLNKATENREMYFHCKIDSKGVTVIFDNKPVEKK